MLCIVLAGILPAMPQGIAAPLADTESSPEPGPHADWDTQDSADSPTPQNAPASERLPAAAAATDCLGSPTRKVRYTSDGVIHLEGCGQSFRLTDLPAAGIGADKLELVDPANKIWLLKAKLKVEEGATLVIAGGPSGDTNWLRLRSDSSSGIWLRAENGNLLFQNTKVTSWNSARNGPDTDVAVAADGTGGRSYIATRSVLTKGRATAAPTACGVAGGSQEPYEGRMDVVNTEIGYLGYNASESYGMVWKVYYKANAADPADAPPPGRQLYALVDVFGDVRGSSFHDNYFGAYTYGAYCMSWHGNTFTNNIQYGLDPHDDSDAMTIVGNIFRDNGNHGLICSVECDHLVIADNESTGNLIGIMLHRNVSASLIQGNRVADNRQDGIALFDSHDNVVRNNIVTNNTVAAVRLSVGSSRNLIENNTLTGLSASQAGSGYVIYTYKGADSPTAGDGLPKQNTFRNNQLTGHKSPLIKVGEATDNLFESNTIASPAADLQFKLATGNIVRNSQLGKTFQITLDSASRVTLEDTRNTAWMLSGSGLGAVVGPSGSMVSLAYANAGPSVAVTPLDLVVRPRNGMIAVQTLVWQGGTRSWSETSDTVTGPVAHAVGGLTAGACYEVTANGSALGEHRADAGGRITFSYSGGYKGAIRFVVTRVSGCVAAAPAHRLLVPLARR
jgi:parallel beta-helix repeat protein